MDRSKTKKTFAELTRDQCAQKKKWRLDASRFTPFCSLAPTDFPQPLPVFALSPCANLRVWRLAPIRSTQPLGERFETDSSASFVDLLRLLDLTRDGSPVVANLKLRGVPLGLAFKHSDAILKKGGLPGRDISVIGRRL
jgi:hypothetical protein